MSLSGTLNVLIETSLSEGDTLTLFNFVSAEGQFDHISVQGSDGCTYDGTLTYGPTSIVFNVDSTTCSTITNSALFLHVIVI